MELRSKSGLALAVVVLTGLAAYPAHAAGNLVQDGGFELSDPSAPANTRDNFAAVTSFDGGFWTVGQGVVGIDTTNKFVLTGKKSLFLTDGSGLNAVTQTLSTVVGQVYTISFDANADSANGVSVLFGGIPVAGAPTTIAQNGFPGAFTTYTATATANSASTVLTLEGFSHFAPTTANQTVEIDNVSVAAVPEASTIASLGLLLASGLGGVLVTARKKAKSAA